MTVAEFLEAEVVPLLRQRIEFCRPESWLPGMTRDEALAVKDELIRLKIYFDRRLREENENDG